MDNNNYLFLSIIVCTYNRANELEPCISELVAQAKEHTNVELIVVDNNSTDNTAEIVKQLAAKYDYPLRYSFELQQGLCVARNHGRKIAHGNIIAYIDDDAIAHSNWISKILQHFSQSKSDCLATKIKVKFLSPPPRWFPKELYWIVGESSFGDVERELTPNECPQGGSFAIRTEVFDEVGGFETRLSLYWDEVAFFSKVPRSKYTMMYQPEIVVDHCVHAAKLTKKALRTKALLMGKGRAQLFHKGNTTLLRRSFLGLKAWLSAAKLAMTWLIQPSFGREFTLYSHVGFAINILKQT